MLVQDQKDVSVPVYHGLSDSSQESNVRHLDRKSDVKPVVLQCHPSTAPPHTCATGK